MSSSKISRRAFVKGSVTALALASIPARISLAQTTVRIRPEWNQFRSSPNYSSFIDAIRAMRANTDSTSRSSWRYWVNVHLNYCPHDIPYFLAWHRGYLYYFEQQLRTVSGNNNLVLPYWNYYQNPTLPAEFTDPASGNPLYVPRLNTNVINALTLAPFNATVWNFERGRTNAFEPSIESMPHNPVHNIIGNVMSTMESPMDPIFYLHHANIDRLWHAWALPDGKGIPASTSVYWSGNFTYAPDLTLPRAQCYHPNRVGTDYSDVTPPSALPPLGETARIIRIQAQGGGGMLNRPPVSSFSVVAPKNLGNGRRSLGGAGGIALGEESVSVRVPIQGDDRKSLRSIIAGTKAKGSTAPSTAGPYKSVEVVLDNVRLLGQGGAGGYFYKVYLNLPQSGDVSPSQEQYLLGTIGPFQLDAAAHHRNSGRLSFPATEVLAKLAPDQLNDLTVSLVRVSGENAPKGRIVAIGELRVEVSSDEPFDTSPQETKPPNVPYR